MEAEATSDSYHLETKVANDASFFTKRVGGKMVIKLDQKGVFEFDNVDEAVEFQFKLFKKTKATTTKISKSNKPKKEKTGRFTDVEEAIIIDAYNKYVYSKGKRKMPSKNLQKLAKKLNRKPMAVSTKAFYIFKG